jgi:Bor protein
MLNRAMTLIASGMVLSGCYHATINTDLPPSNRKIEQKWANAWIFGLVPPETVETAAQCPNGIARVETQLSFLNQLVGILTIGIYTPMSIVVTCAEGSAGEDVDGLEGAVEVNSDASLEVKQAAIYEAAIQSADSGAPVYVRF